MLAKKKIAKVSGNPGKTLLINHFLVNNNWFLVDLPGYGYAKISKKEKKKIENVIVDYFKNRVNRADWSGLSCQKFSRKRWRSTPYCFFCEKYGCHENIWIFGETVWIPTKNLYF